jgi:DNA-binding response OmpR family regulator
MSKNNLLDITKKLTILYVEDDETLLEKGALLFNDIFKYVDTAANGKIAFEMYEEYKYDTNSYYDIVITDFMMPFMNGKELSKQILSKNKNQIIVVISAYNQSDDLIDFINIGINKFITKPFLTKNIIKVLEEICDDIGENKQNIVKLPQMFEYNFKQKELSKNSKTIKLTNSEITILELFLLNPNQIYSNSDIFVSLNTNNYEEKNFSINSIKSMIKRLKQKLPENFIKNIYGQGYKVVVS